MVATAILIIAHTPIWVWGLYALLLLLGLQRTRDSTIQVWRMLTLPCIVTFLAVLTFIGAGPSALPVMLIGVVAGSAAGWQLEPQGASRRLVEIFRYVTSVVAAMDPALNADPTWHFTTLFISAALSGVFLGRTAARLRLYVAAAATA
jgi:hypothetical protein